MAPVRAGTLPGARGPEHPVIKGAGHFLQEDAGPELAEHIVTFIEADRSAMPAG
jgi:haloalkane dehalogenase